MPHINRIRVNNVKYNFGTQFYDDFVMRMDGKNTLYDLANGGGKSVLMLLLFQNLIPNCTLDEKQPIEKLFRTTDGSTSIHSLVEWTLDPEDIEDGYKYMLTGFCARKSKDDDTTSESRETAAIDYFNYVIFYQNYNDNDLINLPLSKGKERMTYVGLRSYLKDLGHKDFSLKVQVFDRKGAYQRFISQYGLYESQWEIIRGINQTEGHVRTYFETNYRTTRKVVEDLLIEEIIQKSFANKTDGGDGDMAATLMSIRDKLLELSKKKSEIANYDRQIEALHSFTGRIESLSKLYEKTDQFKLMVGKTYNGLMNALKIQERNKDAAIKQQNFNQKRLEEVTRKLDTVKVQKTVEALEGLLKGTANIVQTLSQLEADYAAISLKLNQAESQRDYLEYEEAQKNSDIVRRSMESADKGHEELLKDLQMKAACAKTAIDKENQRLNESIKNIKNKLDILENHIKETEEVLREADRNQAVLENNLNQSALREKQLIQEMAAVRQSVNVLLIEGTEKEVKQYIRDQEDLEKMYAEREQEQTLTKQQLNQLTIDLAAVKTKITLGNEKKQQLEQFFQTCQEQQPKIDNLLKVYGVSSYDQLKDAVYSRYEKVAADISETEKQLAQNRTRLQQLEDGNPVPANEGVVKVLDYLRRCHNATCVCGSDYIKDMEASKRKDILEMAPFLPYSVVVHSDFAPLLSDQMLMNQQFAQYQVPVIAVKAIESGHYLGDFKTVLFTGQSQKLFLDNEALTNEKLQEEKQIDGLNQQLKRLESQMETYRDDLDYIHRYVEDYYLRQTEMLAKKAAFDKEMIEAKETLNDVEEQLEYTKNLEAQLETTVLQLKQQVSEAVEKRQAVERVAILSNDLKVLRDNVSQWKKEKNNLAIETDGLNRQNQEEKNQAASIYKQLEQLEQRIKYFDKLWKNQFSLYYTQGEAAGSSETLEEIEVSFRALVETYQAKHSDMEDKKKLLATYEQNMQRLKGAIEARNMTLDQFKENQSSDQFVPGDADTIMTLKSQLESIQEEIKLQKSLAEDAKADQHRLTGRVENAISVIEEKYGTYEAVDLKNMDYEVFIAEYTAMSHQLKETLENIQKEIEDTKKIYSSFEDLKKDLEHLMRTMQVTMNATKESLNPNDNYNKAVKSLMDQYVSLCKEEDAKKAEYERNKGQLTETLVLLKAYDLADEIRHHVTLPKTGADSDELLNQFTETIQIIMLEKDRVQKGIEDMEKIKENFEHQCIQRCVDIRMELERLPKMSHITLGNEDIQMINLKIPYVKEELYSEKMSAYIDSIVDKSDSCKDDDERLKYLKRQLAWKHLFAVIVTDMDGIKMTLYKRERIGEQSRFLRYEEAVGSTGQSQGIYIQFLIGMINYISAINSRNADAAGLKKVIFIDNPFGAAKDVYIWEPIFAMLKENNVQLIVPARGATPAITGKFDVNYVLGQKLIGTKQQTVVVDYHSNIDIEQTEYRQIEFEQEVFDFL